MPISLSGSLNLSGSLTTTGTITATTLVVQTITSSISSITGSTNFGTLSSNTHTFTGSILTSGSIGIGTASPTKALEIISNTSQDGIKISGTSNPRLTIIDTTNNVQFDALTTDTEAVLRTDTNHPLHFSTNGTLRMFISSSGNVGIGTTTPGTRLDVRGVARIGGSSEAVTIGSYTDTYSGYYSVINSTNNGDLSFNSNLYNNGVDLVTVNTHGSMTGASIVLWGNNATLGANTIAFYSRTPGSTTAGTIVSGSNASMVIKGGGNVGIGTSTPTNILTIKNNSGGTNGIDFQNYSTSGVLGQITYSQADDTFNIVNTSAYAAGGIVLKTNSTERMKITSGGNVTIGTNAVPSGAAEFNNGSLFTSNNIFVNNSSGTAGYAVRLDGYSNNLYVLWSTAAGADNGGVGLAYGATSWSPVSSDARTKKNFETTQGLAEILQIEPIKYHLLSDEDNVVKRLGFKAQNLEPLIPEMVHETGKKLEDGSNILTITPDYILPVLVKAIQELTARVQELENK